MFFASNQLKEGYEVCTLIEVIQIYKNTQHTHEYRTPPPSSAF